MINENKYRALLSETETPALAEAPEWKPGQFVRSTISYGLFGKKEGLNRILFKVLGGENGTYEMEVLAADGMWLDRDKPFQVIHSSSPFGMNSEIVPEKVVNPPERKYVESFKLRYRVTKNDIQKGETNQCKTCPQARAIARAFRAKFRRLQGEVNAGVRHYITSLVYEPGEGDQNVIAYKATTGEAVRKFFQAFDNGLPVEPGNFEMEFKRFRGRVNVPFCEIDV